MCLYVQVSVHVDVEVCTYVHTYIGIETTVHNQDGLGYASPRKILSF